MKINFNINIFDAIKWLSNEKYSFEKEEESFTFKINKMRKTVNVSESLGIINSLDICRGVYYDKNEYEVNTLFRTKQGNCFGTEKIDNYFSQKYRIILFILVTSSLNYIQFDIKKNSGISYLKLVSIKNELYDLFLSTLANKLYSQIYNSSMELNRGDFGYMYTSSVNNLRNTSTYELAGCSMKEMIDKFIEETTDKSIEEIDKENYERQFTKQDLLLRIIKEFWYEYKNKFKMD